MEGVGSVLPISGLIETLCLRVLRMPILQRVFLSMSAKQGEKVDLKESLSGTAKFAKVDGVKME